MPDQSTTTNPFIAWLQELFLRLGTKSPKFFKVLQWILGFLTAISGIPPLLVQFDIALPPEINQPFMKIVAFAAGAAFFVAMLTTQSKVVAVTPDGTLLKKTDEKALPFTSQNEQKTVDKKEAEPPVVEVKPNTSPTS